MGVVREKNETNILWRSTAIGPFRGEYQYSESFRAMKADLNAGVNKSRVSCNPSRRITDFSLSLHKIIKMGSVLGDFLVNCSDKFAVSIPQYLGDT